MSSIDKRVVQLEFNSKQFEAGTKTSLDALTKFKGALAFGKEIEEIRKLQKQTDKFSLEKMAIGVDALQHRFTTMGIVGMQAIENLTNKAINSGQALVASLTTAPVSAGYKDYEEKLTSVNTVMNTTGESIETVTSYFDQLDEYADNTIYNLKDMTSSFAKFTNAGVSMDKAVPAIKGIANMTALAGQGSEQAAIGMYNLSQSISGGFLTRMDFKSLELANIATKEWKQRVVDSAIAMGTLKDAGDGMYRTLGGDVQTLSGLFVNSLAEGWANSDVLLSVLGDYADTTTDVGAKAQSAAQDVKSFGMMMETLRAQVGTSWTDTFEILFGNVEEAKLLWTPITKSVGDFLDVFSNARNELLLGWKLGGGRDALLETLSNLAKLVSSIVKPISEAWAAVFPPTTVETLLDFTFKFKDLISKFTFGEQTTRNLRDVFLGLFSVLNIIKKVITVVILTFGKLIQVLMPVMDIILAILAPIGMFLYLLDQGLGPVTAFGSQLEYLRQIVQEFAWGFLNATDNVTSSISRIRNELLYLKNSDDPFGEKIKNVSAFALIIGAVVGAIVTAVDAIKMAFRQLGNAFKNNMDPTAVVVAVGAAVGGGLLFSIYKTLKKFIDLFKKGALVDLRDSITEVFKSLSNSINEFQQTVKAKNLRSITLSVLMLAFALVILAAIDPVRLGTALGALSVMFGELLGTFAVIEKLTKNLDGGAWKRMYATAAIIFVIGASLLMMADALLKISDIPWKNMALGIAAMGIMLGMLIGTMFALDKLSKAKYNRKKVMAQLILLYAVTVVLNKLANVLAKIGALPFEQIKNGIYGMTIVMALTMVLLDKLDKLKSDPKKLKMKALVIGSIAGALMLLSMSVKMLGSMDVKSLGQGLIAVGVLFGMLFLFLKYLNPKALKDAASGILIISFGLLNMVTAIALLGLLPIDVLLKGMGALGTLLFIIAGVIMAMSQDAAKTMQGAASILLFAAAMQMLIPTLILLSQLSLPQLGIMILGLVAIFGIFIGTMYLLKPVIETFILFGFAIILIGTGVYLLGLGIIALSAGLLALAASGLGVINLIKLMIITLIEMIPAIAEAIALGFVKMILVIGMFGVQIRDALVKIAIESVKGFLNAFVSILGLLVSLIPKIVELGAKLFLGLLKGIRDNIFEITTVVVDIILNFIAALTAKLPDIIMAGFNFIISFINGMANAIRESTPKLVDAVDNLIDAIFDSFAYLLNEGKERFTKFGTAILDGLKNGIKNAASSALGAIKGVGQAIVNAFMDILGIDSPSKEFAKLGKYTVQGLANGINNSGTLATKSAKELGTKTLNAFQKSISNINNLISDNIDNSPTIRPILDLTDIQSKNKELNNMLGISAGYSPAGTNSVLLSAAATTNAPQPTSQNTTTVNEIKPTFVINANGLDEAAARILATKINKELGNLL